MKTFVKPSIQLMTPKLIPIFIFMIIIIVRLPLLNLGYGHRADAWRTIIASEHLADTGEYQVSRFPGYPITEITYALIKRLNIPLNYVVANTLTVVMTALASIIFYYIIRIFDISYLQAMLTALSMSFVPIIFAYSAISLEYLWALFFVLSSTYAVLIKKYSLGGIFLGLAIGTRIISGGMIIPLVIMIIQDKNRKGILYFISLSFIFSLLSYLIVILEYQFSFLTFADNVGYPSLISVLNSATVNVWGKVGLVALASAFTIIVTSKYVANTLTFKNVFQDVMSKYNIFLLSVCFIYGIAFIRLPHEPAYLIIVVPFVILAIAKSTNKYAIYLLAVILIFNGLRLIPTLINSRTAQLNRAEKILLSFDYPNDKDVIVVSGFMQPILMKLAGSQNTINIQNVEFVYVVSEEEVKDKIALDTLICIPKEVKDWILQRYKFDIEEYTDCIV